MATLADGWAPHRQRVIVEGRELADRLTKLRTFCEGPELDRLAKEEQRLLLDQVEAMSHYLLAINRRLVYWVSQGSN